MSITKKIKGLQISMDILRSQLTGVLGSNDKLLIEINGLAIEKHKLETLVKLGLI